MDPKKLVEFLGHSSIYEPLDDFLILNGVKKRPKGPDLTDWIGDKSKAISLEFSASYDSEAIHPRKSDGKYVLRAIVFEKPLESGLPFGLDFRMPRDAVTAILGAPKASDDMPSAEYYYDSLVVTIVWEKDERKMRLITISVPDIYSKKNLNLP